MIDCLRPFVQIVHVFSALLGEAAGLMIISSAIAFSLSDCSLYAPQQPPTKAIFGRTQGNGSRDALPESQSTRPSYDVSHVMMQLLCFRWVVCQLEALRHYFPSAIRHALNELPKKFGNSEIRSYIAWQTSGETGIHATSF